MADGDPPGCSLDDGVLHEKDMGVPIVGIRDGKGHIG